MNSSRSIPKRSMISKTSSGKFCSANKIIKKTYLMSVVIITGSNGLVGSESVNFFSKKGFDVVGIDNNLRQFFFGKDASTLWVKNKLINSHKNFKHFTADIRNYKNLENKQVSIGSWQNKEVAKKYLNESHMQELTRGTKPTPK